MNQLKMLMIGSHAAYLHGVILRGSAPLDVDFIADKDSFDEFVAQSSPVEVREIDDNHFALFYKGIDAERLNGWLGLPPTQNLIIEFEIAVPGSTGETLLKHFTSPDCRPTEKCETSILGVDVFIAPMAILYLLKMSHRFKKNSKHFEKTRRDIAVLRRHLKQDDQILMSILSPWFKRREKETIGYKHPKLIGESKGAFFDPSHGVNYVYDHDSIHVAVKHLERPAYTYYQPEGAQVETSREMFEALPKAVRLLGVLEEAYVLTLERSIIPHNLWDQPDKIRGMFRFALEKVCTSITSGWFREFGWENFDTVLGMFDIEFVNRFKEQAEAGKIALYTGSMYN